MLPGVGLICAAALALALCLTSGESLAEPPAILDTDSVQFTTGVFGEEKTPAGTVELVEGKFGKACRFSFVEGSRGGFFNAGIEPSPAWDQAAGISFWVKGDGSASWGGMELVDPRDFKLRYAYWFPIDSTEWTKVVVPWCDLIPFLPQGPFVDPKGEFKPSNFGLLRFGKQIRYWEFPAHSFAVDHIALEPSIVVDTTDYTPADGGTPRFLAKLKAKEPVTVVTMGDSLSDKHHWANREALWSELLVKKLAEVYGGEVTLVNPAVGGNQLMHGLVHMTRWIRTTPEPDLVTVWFGGNDWGDGMRGERFREVLRFTVDRIRRFTKGKSDILLMTNSPGLDGKNERGELGEAARAAAREKHTGLADVCAALASYGKEQETRNWLYVWDGHIGPLGHPLIAMTVFDAIAAGAAPD